MIEQNYIKKKRLQITILLLLQQPRKFTKKQELFLLHCYQFYRKHILLTICLEPSKFTNKS